MGDAFCYRKWLPIMRGVDHCMHREHTEIRRSMLNHSAMKPSTKLEIRKSDCGRGTDAE